MRLQPLIPINKLEICLTLGFLFLQDSFIKIAEILTTSKFTEVYSNGADYTLTNG